MVMVYRPENLQEAIAIRGQENALLLAGGTDLMVRQRSWSGVGPNFSRPVLLIAHLTELRHIWVNGESIVIGASATLNEILGHPDIPIYIKQPLSKMASPAIRNVATLGGNICNASPAGDSLPMLYALEAVLTLQSASGSRQVAVDQFITGPGSNSLADDEILTSITIPVRDYNLAYYKKVGTRKANAISKLSFYGLASLRQGRVEDIRISLGAVGPTPVRSREAEALMRGAYRGELPELIEAVREIYRGIIKPIDDVRSTRSYRLNTAMRILDYFILKELNHY